MKRVFLLLTLIGLSFLVSCSSLPGETSDLGFKGAWLAEESVFGILVETRETGRWSGTGFAFGKTRNLPSDPGPLYTLILTNRHIFSEEDLGRALVVIVTLPHPVMGMDSRFGKLVGSSRKHDISILACRRGGDEKRALRFHPDPELFLSEGQEVVVIGRPQHGKSIEISYGRTLPSSRMDIGHIPEGLGARHLITSARTHQGWSGAPVLDRESGWVVGMVWGGTYYAKADHRTYAVPLKEIQETIDQILSSKGIVLEK